MPVVPYGVAIHKAAASGDINQMKEVAEHAEKWLAEHGNVAAALEILKHEIAKRESRKG